MLATILCLIVAVMVTAATLKPANTGSQAVTPSRGPIKP
jgi:hypothetical protein